MGTGSPLPQASPHLASYKANKCLVKGEGWGGLWEHSFYSNAIFKKVLSGE